MTSLPDFLPECPRGPLSLLPTRLSPKQRSLAYITYLDPVPLDPESPEDSPEEPPEEPPDAPPEEPPDELLEDPLETETEGPKVP